MPEHLISRIMRGAALESAEKEHLIRALQNTANSDASSKSTLETLAEKTTERLINEHNEARLNLHLTHDWEGGPLDTPLTLQVRINASSIDIWHNPNSQDDPKNSEQKGAKIFGMILECCGKEHTQNGVFVGRVYQATAEEPVTFNLEQ